MFRGGYPSGTVVREKTISKPERDAAKTAARAALPRVYKLEGLKSDLKLRFIALGCQGTAGNAQSQVADAINKFITNNTEEEPDFVLLLGDNFYPKGVKSPRSAQFEDSFQKPYRALIKKDIPFFGITGNHDYNMRDEAAIKASIQTKLKSPFKSKSKPKFLPASTDGIDLILNQVAYGYLPDSKGTTKEKIARFENDTLNLNELAAWNMPARYYALDAGDTRIICLDSSTYIADYVLKEQPYQMPSNNQALWLETITAEAKAANKQCILAMHHPAYSPGKRAFKNDLNLYLDKTQRDKIRKQFPHFEKECTPYNTYLSACLLQQGLRYDLILTAHDHNQYYYNNGVIKQLTMGAGGGPLQPRVAFGEQSEMGSFRKIHGFAAIKTTLAQPEKIKFSMHALNQSPLFFSNQSVNAKQHAFDDDITRLITAVQQAVNDYFAFIASKQNADRKHFLLTNLSHGKGEIKCAHQAWALISEKDVGDYITLLKRLDAITSKTIPYFSEEAEHAFSRLLNNALEAQIGVGTTLKGLLKKTENSATPSPNHPRPF